MLDDITLYWLTGGSRQPDRLPDRPVGTRHEEKTMTTFELDNASIRDRALLDYPWKETRKERCRRVVAVEVGTEMREVS